MNIEVKYHISKERSGRQIGDSSSSFEIDTESFLESFIDENQDVDLGYMSYTLRSFRTKHGRTQVVVEIPPGVNRVLWAMNEEGSEEEHYLLAQPYIIIIGEYHLGEFIGARVFYSTVPAVTPDIPLYNANLSNVNALGYRGDVGVGWICLYRHTSTKNMSWQERINLLIYRCSGQEAFNFANMRETDGMTLYRIYSDEESLIYLDAWEERSRKEGYEWILNSEILIPVKVNSEEDQTANNICDLDDIRSLLSNGFVEDIDIDSDDYHHSAVDYCRNIGSEYQRIFDIGSVHLTLDMAMNGSYSMYYTDDVSIKPFSPRYERTIRLYDSMSKSFIRASEA